MGDLPSRATVLSCCALNPAHKKREQGIAPVGVSATIATAKAASLSVSK